MELFEKIKGYEIKYIENVPYFDIDGYIFFYYCLNDKHERFALCLNKPLIRKSDISIINKKIKKFAKTCIDNIAYKNDLLFIELFDFSDIYTKLVKIKDVLYDLNYKNRNNCILCGKKAELNLYKNAIVPIEKECINKLINDENIKTNLKKKYFKKSLLLSLLGGFVGILPTILLNYFLGSYTIMSTILLFLSPFLSVLLFNLSDMPRSKSGDILNMITSLSFVILNQVFIFMMYWHLYEIKSIIHYLDVFNYLLLETFIEIVFAYVIGLFSGYFMVKKREIIKISYQKK